MKRADQLDAIIVETTGLADPAPVAQTFFVDQDVADRTKLDAIVTVADAVHPHRQEALGQEPHRAREKGAARAGAQGAERRQGGHRVATIGAAAQYHVGPSARAGGAPRVGSRRAAGCAWGAVCRVALGRALCRQNFVRHLCLTPVPPVRSRSRFSTSSCDSLCVSLFCVRFTPNERNR